VKVRFGVDKGEQVGGGKINESDKSELVLTKSAGRVDNARVFALSKQETRRGRNENEVELFGMTGDRESKGTGCDVGYKQTEENRSAKQGVTAKEGKTTSQKKKKGEVGGPNRVKCGEN
jgi:hypothetical protein